MPPVIGGNATTQKEDQSKIYAQLLEIDQQKTEPNHNPSKFAFYSGQNAKFWHAAGVTSSDLAIHFYKWGYYGEYVSNLVERCFFLMCPILSC
jgi:hypothetical protein